jgi:hypothetical protein
MKYLIYILTLSAILSGCGKTESSSEIPGAGSSSTEPAWAKPSGIDNPNFDPTNQMHSFFVLDFIMRKEVAAQEKLNERGITNFRFVEQSNGITVGFFWDANPTIAGSKAGEKVYFLTNEELKKIIPQM